MTLRREPSASRPTSLPTAGIGHHVLTSPSSWNRVLLEIPPGAPRRQISRLMKVQTQYGLECGIRTKNHRRRPKDRALSRVTTRQVCFEFLATCGDRQCQRVKKHFPEQVQAHFTSSGTRLAQEKSMHACCMRPANSPNRQEWTEARAQGKSEP